MAASHRIKFVFISRAFFSVIQVMKLCGDPGSVYGGTCLIRNQRITQAPRDKKRTTKVTRSPLNPTD